MRRLFSAIVLAVLACSEGTAGASLEDPASLERFLDGTVSALMKQHHTASGVVAIEHRGAVAVLKGYGWQDVDAGIPTDPRHTLFRVASISKLFTWVAVMQLVEKGKLDLDADVNTYLRDFRIADTYPGRPITVRHCMTHTSGFEEGYLGFLHPLDLRDVLSHADAMKRYQPMRIRPPGSASAYSNYCAALSGLIVAILSGQSFEQYVQQQILDPLGMSQATFAQPLSAEMQRHLATAYAWREGTYRALPFELDSGYAPSGRLTASAPDMLRFGRAMLNGGQLDGGVILRSQSVAQLLSPQVTPDPRLKGIALGFLQFAHGKLDALEHNGNTMNFSSHFAIVPAEDLVIFVSFGGPGYREVTAAVARALYEEMFPVAPPIDRPPSGFAQRAGKFTGTYIPRRSNFSTLEKLLQLRSQIAVTATSDGALLIDGKRYVEIEEHLFRGSDNGDLLAFEFDDSGAKASGFARDAAPYLSFFRAPPPSTWMFNRWLLLLCGGLFAMVLLRRLFCWRMHDRKNEATRVAERTALAAAACHTWTLVFGAYALSATAPTLLSRIPMVLKVALIFPMLASLVSFLLLYQAVKVWKHGLLASVPRRCAYSIVAAASLAMVWFYYYWNMLGFQYR